MSVAALSIRTLTAGLVSVGLLSACATASGPVTSLDDRSVSDAGSAGDGQGVRDAGPLPGAGPGSPDSGTGTPTPPPTDAGPPSPSDAGSPDADSEPPPLVVGDAGSGTPPSDAAGPPDTGAGADAAGDAAGSDDASADAGTTTPPDDGGTASGAARERAGATCGFNYGFRVETTSPLQRPVQRISLVPDSDDIAPIAHAEPAPLGYRTMPLWVDRGWKSAILDELVLPIYEDATPLFERARDWEGGSRCYELADGAWTLNEEAAYQLYVDMVRQTLWYDVDQTPGRRTVVGVRGSWPGAFRWTGNAPNQFNDTIVLLWRDSDGVAHVREFPVNTDTGAHDFGRDSSSSLVPNRHYPYVNGWHRSYNALSIDLPGYPVRDDANNNGHWDSDRNGWLSGGEADYDRNGSAHNIHMGAIDEPLGSASINTWSAGCQVIPGEDNWLEFIGNVWTGLGDKVDYYLLDARDIAPSVFTPCTSLDGSHGCPFEIRALPYSHSGTTAAGEASRHARYNCSTANEAGRERVYVLNLAQPARLTVTVTTPDESTVDPDIHLLTGDDANACLSRAHRELTWDTIPGRYVIVVDSWTNASGVSLEGAYTLNVSAVPR